MGEEPGTAIIGPGKRGTSAVQDKSNAIRGEGGNQPRKALHEWIARRYSQLEAEEMKVDVPGFKGGDRTSLDLPAEEEELLKALGNTGKPLVTVLRNGSALSVNWAILDAWYSGEEGGTAVAQTLADANNPAGGLPVTFYRGIDQLPLFEDHAMKKRTYRYFEGEPPFPIWIWTELLDVDL